MPVEDTHAKNSIEAAADVATDTIRNLTPKRCFLIPINNEHSMSHAEGDIRNDHSAPSGSLLPRKSQLLGSQPFAPGP